MNTLEKNIFYLHQDFSEIWKYFFSYTKLIILLYIFFLTELIILKLKNYKL